jgi:hypothetical protein
MITKCTGSRFCECINCERIANVLEQLALEVFTANEREDCEHEYTEKPGTPFVECGKCGDIT